jgi:hypothetical protein
MHHTAVATNVGRPTTNSPTPTRFPNSARMPPTNVAHNARATSDCDFQFFEPLPVTPRP